MAEALPDHDRIKEEVTCPVCLELFKCPLLLPCSHTFCKACLETMLAKSASPHPSLRCPQCQETVRLPQGVEQLKKNILVGNIVASLRRTESCVTLPPDADEEKSDRKDVRKGPDRGKQKSIQSQLKQLQNLIEQQQCDIADQQEQAQELLGRIAGETAKKKKEVSDNFRTLTAQLQVRERELHQEVEASQVKATALLQGHLTSLESRMTASLSTMDRLFELLKKNVSSTESLQEEVDTFTQQTKGVCATVHKVSAEDLLTPADLQMSLPSMDSFCREIFFCSQVKVDLHSTSRNAEKDQTLAVEVQAEEGEEEPRQHERSQTERKQEEGKELLLEELSSGSKEEGMPDKEPQTTTGAEEETLAETETLGEHGSKLIVKACDEHVTEEVKEPTGEDLSLVAGQTQKGTAEEKVRQVQSEKVSAQNEPEKVVWTTAKTCHGNDEKYGDGTLEQIQSGKISTQDEAEKDAMSMTKAYGSHGAEKECGNGTLKQTHFRKVSGQNEAKEGMIEKAKAYRGNWAEKECGNGRVEQMQSGKISAHNEAKNQAFVTEAKAYSGNGVEKKCGDAAKQMKSGKVSAKNKARRGGAKTAETYSGKGAEDKKAQGQGLCGNESMENLLQKLQYSHHASHSPRPQGSGYVVPQAYPSAKVQGSGYGFPQQNPLLGVQQSGYGGYWANSSAEVQGPGYGGYWANPSAMPQGPGYESHQGNPTKQQGPGYGGSWESPSGMPQEPEYNEYEETGEDMPQEPEYDYEEDEEGMMKDSTDNGYIYGVGAGEMPQGQLVFGYETVKTWR